MEVGSLRLLSDCLAAASGSTLSPDERARFYASLMLLQETSGASRVTYWGRLLGGNKDYVLAQAHFAVEGEHKGHDGSLCDYFDTVEHMPRTTYRLGSDGVTWVALPPVDEQSRQSVADWEAHLGRQGTTFEPFTGEPGTELAYQVIIPAEQPEEQPEEVAEGEDAPAPPEPTVEDRTLSEETRLAVVVSAIDHDTSVVPLGSFVLNSKNQIVPNPNFTGLKQLQGKGLQGYCHLRKSTVNASKQRGALERSTAWADLLISDEPSSCWSVQYDGYEHQVVLRSLLWPGYCFFHRIGEVSFGATYRGQGDRNRDIAFMLNRKDEDE